MLHFEVGEEYHKFGVNEDGRDVIGSRYFILATGERGDRLRHFANFSDIVVHVDEEYGHEWFEPRPEARDNAEQLLARINARGTITPEFWDWNRPAYLSDAYLENYEEYERDIEEDY